MFFEMIIVFTFLITGIAYGQSNEEELKKSFIQTIQKGEITYEEH